MRNITRASLLASIISAIGLYEDGPQPTAFRAPRVRKSRRYPEQSSRQAMRGHRRAQGGIGIELNRRTHEYQPKAFF